MSWEIKPNSSNLAGLCERMYLAKPTPPDIVPKMSTRLVLGVTLTASREAHISSVATIMAMKMASGDITQNTFLPK